ncbi:MAG: glycosyltransferase family 2 protein [Clostridia bacterium]|nr:glycosyltransferase family 2 protein [Clostridia bacterium]
MVNNNPLISILMGVYNCEKTLQTAVESILKQTYTNWELIICDDGSLDGTYEMALEIAALDERIIVLKNEKNITLAPTLNKCFSVAKGELIARMDGDDFCDSSRLEKEYKAMVEQNVEIVSCFMELFDEKGVYGIEHYPERPVGKDFLHDSKICHAGCLMKASALKKVGGYSEADEYCRVEDYDLWVRMYAEGFKAYNIQEVLYSMRDDRNAIKRRTFKNRVNEMRVKRKVVKYFNLPWYSNIYCISPIIKYFVPKFIYNVFHGKP